MKTTASPMTRDQQLREMNEALLISSVHQHELTEQAQQAEAEMRNSQELLRRNAETFSSLVEHSPYGIYTVDSDFCIYQVSDGAQAAFRNVRPLIGCDLGKAMRTLWPEPFASEVVDIFRHTLETGEPYIAPSLTEHRRDLDVVESYEWQTHRVTLADGEYGVVCHFYDTTRLRRTEKRLRESEERYRSLTQAITSVVWTTNNEGRFVNPQPSWSEYTGQTWEEARDFGWANALHEDDRQRVRDLWAAACNSGSPYKSDGRVWHAASNAYRHFEARGVPILNADGTVREWVGKCLDVEDRKRAEKEARKARDMADEANAAKDMFLATLSHEMRTPLSAIIGWMSILQGGTQSGCSDDEINEGLDVIERNARTMVQLLDDVLDVSRIVSGKLRLEVRPCDLSKVIRSGIDVVRSAAQAKDIAISSQLDPAASAVSCDAARMQQVVWNLLSNAVKFTPKGGTVRVTLAREPSEVRIQISDSGPGIGPELLPYVFDRFRQADNSTRRHFGGLGLGLAIVKQLVELHGGTVYVESAGQGQGSTFTVCLPIRAVRTDDNAVEPGGEKELQQSATTAPPVVRLDGLRVLVVDDEADARRLLVKVLEQTGAVITAVSSAAEAIDALKKVNPQVLISDLGMPDQDGFDLIRQIRANGHLAKDLPAVALTAFVRKQDGSKALLAGYQMHIPKPADPHDLTAVIASLAGRTA